MTKHSHVLIGKQKVIEGPWSGRSYHICFLMCMMEKRGKMVGKYCSVSQFTVSMHVKSSL